MPMNRDAAGGLCPHYSQMQKHVYKGKATILITGHLGDSHGHGPALLLSAPISLQVTHQGKGWAPALHRLSPSTLYAFWPVWDAAGTVTVGLLPQLELGVPISEKDACVPHSPLKIWPKCSRTSLMGLLDHSDQHQAGKSWESFSSFLKTNACSNSVEWGQGSSLMFKTVIQ